MVRSAANGHFHLTLSPVSILEGECTSNPENGPVASNLQNCFTPGFHSKLEANVVTVFALTGASDSQIADTRQHLQAHSVVFTIQLRMS